MELDRLSMAWIRLGSMKDHNRHQWVHVMPFWFGQRKRRPRCCKEKAAEGCSVGTQQGGLAKAGDKSERKSHRSKQDWERAQKSAITAEGIWAGRV